MRSLWIIIFMMFASPVWADIYQSEYFTLTFVDDINKGKPSKNN